MSNEKIALVKVRPNYTVTIPADLVKGVKIKLGDWVLIEEASGGEGELSLIVTKVCCEAGGKKLKEERS